FVRYFEVKEKMIFWWAAAWLFFGLHALTELAIIQNSTELLWFIRHIFYALTAVAFLESVGNMRAPVLKKGHIAAIVVTLGIIAISYIGVFVVRDWYAAVVPIALFNGMGFIACGVYFFKFTKERRSAARLPILLGFFLNGAHNLDYPFLRNVEWFAPIGFGLGVLFSLIFAVGLAMMSTEELKRQKEDIQRKVKSQLALTAVFSLVSQSLNLQEILNNALDRILEVIRVDRGCIFLLDREKEELNLRVHRGFSADYIKSITWLELKEDNMYTEVARTGKPVIIANISEDPRLTIGGSEKRSVRSCACIPLMSKGKIVGVLSLLSRSYYRLVPEEMRMLNSIGAAVGVAVENARLYETVKSWGEKLEKIVEERTKDLSDARKATLNILEDIDEAYKELKEAQAQLVQKERLAAIGQMAAVMGHELRNPLTGVKMAAYYLNEKLKKIGSPLTKSVQDIEKETERASLIISNILEFSRPPKLFLNPVDINVILEEAINSAQGKKWLKDIKVIKDFQSPGLMVALDAFRFRQALDNIILNAHQAMPAGGELTVRAKVVKDELEIRISDSGGGIAKENIKRIFEPFFTDKHRGVGLGLAVVSEVVKGHNGSISVESEAGKGSTFIIRLPIKKER
ncbi:MAG: GAF domain-containing protein, partial [Candidatus Omnitrophica bacterium]|nr:GAF domain-containing protein [Candidatus Omnitrophota bacterium]